MTESKEKDTKETTPEATPEDVNTLIEKTLATEEKTEAEEPKKEPETKQADEFTLKTTVEEVENQTEKTEKGMRPETKTALVVLALILPCIAYAYLMAFSDKVLINNVYFYFVLAAVTGAVCAFFGVVLLILTSCDDKIYIRLFCLFFLIFTIPLIAFIIPLSKYHNLNQIERDKKIVEIFQISKEKDKIMIILPDEYYQEHKYLKKVLSVVWKVTDSNNIEDHIKSSWSDIAIPCRRGSKNWYEAELLLPKTATDIELRFDHVWKDWKATKKILLPDPTDPNSL